MFVLRTLELVKLNDVSQPLQLKHHRSVSDIFDLTLSEIDSPIERICNDRDMSISELEKRNVNLIKIH